MLGNWGNKEAGKPDLSDSTVNETLKFCKSSALFFFFFFLSLKNIIIIVVISGLRV